MAGNVPDRTSWQDAVCRCAGCLSSQPVGFEVPAFTQDQKPGGTFISSEVCTQGSTPCNLAAVLVVKSSW